MISDAMLAQIHRKQEQFLEALLQTTQLWTRELNEDRALEAGRLVGLEPILVSEFLVYWADQGKIDSRYVELAGRIQARVLANQVDLSYPQPGTAAEAAVESGLHPAIAVKYDVALSFAGEDRQHARELAQLLRREGHSVFYDEYEQATLWGKNLYTHLSDVYQNRARFCVIFISARYAEKLWTKREREAAQARAFRESSEYILPLRLDDTDLPGIEDTIGYVDLRDTSVEEIVRLLTHKLRSTRGIPSG